MTLEQYRLLLACVQVLGAVLSVIGLLRAASFLNGLIRRVQVAIGLLRGRRPDEPPSFSAQPDTSSEGAAAVLAETRTEDDEPLADRVATIAVQLHQETVERKTEFRAASERARSLEGEVRAGQVAMNRRFDDALDGLRGELELKTLSGRGLAIAGAIIALVSAVLSAVLTACS